MQCVDTLLPPALHLSPAGVDAERLVGDVGALGLLLLLLLPNSGLLPILLTCCGWPQCIGILGTPDHHIPTGVLDALPSTIQGRVMEAFPPTPLGADKQQDQKVEKSPLLGIAPESL